VLAALAEGLGLGEKDGLGDEGPEGLGITASALGLTEGPEVLEGVAVGSLGREGEMELRFVNGGAGVAAV
jgi:hypothetical protein